MPRICTVCSNPDRTAIDRALLEGAGFRTIANRFDVSEHALKRHRKEHVSERLAQATQAADVADADDLLAEMRDLKDRAVRMLDTAEKAGDIRTAIMCLREAAARVETLLEVEGELDRRGTVNITVSQQWLSIRAVLFEALKDFPDARIAVASRLQALESGL